MIGQIKEKIKKQFLLYKIGKFIIRVLNIVENSIISILLLPISPVSIEKFIIITGSDSRYYKSLKQLLLSILLYEKNTKVIVFDLGLSNEESNELKRQFRKIELRKFDYSKYPEYLNIKKNAGEYAWKPVIISNILDEFKSSVFWMDAGNVICSPLITIRKIIKLTGFYSPFSEGNIFKWTHHETLKFLKVSKNIQYKRNLSGGCVAINYDFDKVKKTIHKWKDCALTKECIAPEGSSRKNHRQDQAVLSILAYQANIVNRLFNKFYGFKIHQNIN